MGERYRRFVEQTSFTPGAALLGGREQFDPARDMSWLAIVIGTVLTMVLVAIHPGPSAAIRWVKAILGEFFEQGASASSVILSEASPRAQSKDLARARARQAEMTAYQRIVRAGIRST